MTREIPFIAIDDEYGGDQGWLPEAQMRRGGCSTIVAAEISTCLRSLDEKYKKLSPLEMHTSRENFVEYACTMYKYVWPKYRGLPSLDYFEECYNEFAESVGEKVSYDRVDETEDYAKAEEFVRKYIDKGYPIAFLVLRHESRLVYDITWHWFNITGYEYTENGMDVFFATYGEKCRLPLKELWEKGNPDIPVMEDESGGLIVIK